VTALLRAPIDDELPRATFRVAHGVGNVERLQKARGLCAWVVARFLLPSGKGLDVGEEGLALRRGRPESVVAGPQQGDQLVEVPIEAWLLRAGRHAPHRALRDQVRQGEVDKELEKRGHAFVRYADDCAPRRRRREASRMAA
jgi:hypothetical protein